jgi:DDE superfamily endonuclease
LIKNCLPIHQKLYNVTKRFSTKEEVEQYLPDFGLCGLYYREQQIPRPTKKNRKIETLCTTQARERRNTLSRICSVNQKGRIILYKTKQKQRGRRHDYRIYKKNHPDLPTDIMSMYDLGFLDVEKDFLEQESLLPIKKEKDHELTEVLKEYNKNHSAKRIVIEYAIYRIKKYKIMNDVFRNRLRKYDSISDIVS